MKSFMRLFKWRSTTAKHTDDQSFLFRILHGMEVRKRSFANVLSQRFEQLSKRNRKLVLLMFGAIMGGLSLYLILSPFSGLPRSWSFADRTEMPKPIIRQPMEPLVSKKEHDLLVSYRATLDSLKLHDPGTYELLLHGRQGLIDSLNFLINLHP